MIFSLLMMSRRMLLSSSYILVFLLCLLHECNGRHLSSIDDHHALDAQLLSHSTIKGFEKDTFRVLHDDLNNKMNKERRHVKAINTIDGANHKRKDYKGALNKKQMMKTEKVKKVKEEEAVHRHHHPKASLATVSFRVPPRNKGVQQQPGFNLDYSPPKTHPPSHN